MTRYDLPAILEALFALALYGFLIALLCDPAWAVRLFGHDL